VWDVVKKQAELDQRLRELVESLAAATESVRDVLARVHASVLQATAELNQIELFPSGRDPIRIDCFDCGQQNLQIFHTSKRHGYHLCPDCFRSRERRGLAQSGEPHQSDRGLPPKAEETGPASAGFRWRTP
jgi:hypothetical protein